MTAIYAAAVPMSQPLPELDFCFFLSVLSEEASSELSNVGLVPVAL